MSRGGQVPSPALSAEAFRTLSLLPTAPLELVTEVYWHLIREARAQAKEDPRVDSRLDQLNEAYAALVQPSRAPTTTSHREPGGEEAGDHVRTGRHLDWPRRGPKSQPVESGGKSSPWAVLHVSPGAPTGIVDLAYGFWRARLRSLWGESRERAAARLDKAYRAVREGLVESSVASELSPVSSAESAADPSAAFEEGRVRPAQGDSSAVMSGQGDRGRLWTARLGRLARQSAVWTGRLSLSIARAVWRGLQAYAPRAWRLAKRIAVYAARAGMAGGERLMAAFRGRERAPDPVDEEQFRAVEERFKALAATREGDRQATEGASHEDERPGPPPAT